MTTVVPISRTREVKRLRARVAVLTAELAEAEDAARVLCRALADITRDSPRYRPRPDLRLVHSSRGESC